MINLSLKVVSWFYDVKMTKNDVFLKIFHISCSSDDSSSEYITMKTFVLGTFIF